MKKSLLLFLLVIKAFYLFAQTAPLSGKVVDSETQKPLDFVTVQPHRAKVPVFTDEAGVYALRQYHDNDKVSFTLLGYGQVTKTVQELKQQPNISLVRQSVSLQEIVIGPQENPAFKIVRAAARKKEQYLPENQKAMEFETYTLMKGSILESEAKDKKRRFSKRFAPYLDSLLVGDTPAKLASIPIFQSETVKLNYFIKDPKKAKEVLKASKVVGVGIEKEAQIAQLLNAQAEHFSFNQNYLRMFDKDFVSPIASGWSNYYDYDLEDSVETSSGKVYKLKIIPKRPQDLTFSGTMWIADGTFALRRIEVKMSPAVKLNFITDLRIVQVWDDSYLSLLPISSKRKFQISGLPGTEVKLFVETATHYRDLVLNQPRAIDFFDNSHVMGDSVLKYKDAFWQSARPASFAPEDLKRVESIAQINKLPEIQSTVKLIRVIVEGHLPVNDKLEWGPIFGTYVFNNIEGHRFQLGARTTEAFHKNWILNGYVGYGTRDKSVKGLLNVRYVANRERWTEWGASYLNDVGPAAMDLNNTRVNSLFFSAFRWGDMNFPYKQERIQVWAEREWVQSFTQRITLRHSKHTPVFYSAPVAEGEFARFGKFRTTDLIINLQYTPNRKTLIRHWDKVGISNSNSPVIGLEVSLGMDGLLNSDLSYQQVAFSVEQRIRAGVLGYGRYYFRAEKTFNQVPLPLLQVPVGNETPFFILHGYNLMPFFSFANDEMVSLRYDHHFEGALSLTNRIPLLKKTRARLVAGGAMMMGHLSEKNQSTAVEGDPNFGNFRGLGKDPYAEVNVGLKNLFQLVRVDLVHRLTYKQLDMPQWGLRMSISVNP
ncbi:hypothetical protein TH61_14610 [Rufibacter sp. DG15C]|uniref:DUF5686 family protein n=1 Tax=Rufibacter sp. DG15C TaxID=1379909 RepID=UPI00078D6E95|nr:DUF5686 family protein [Rufibacter sp. DG15C]AMM52168.1 hypothetical protein TH61_14610 [Rufibacter sp. DG15C]